MPAKGNMSNRTADSQGLVLCLTNTVAANFTANVLLAIGAKPAMIEEPSEAAELAAVADAVLVNVGTVTPAQADAMRAAIAVCKGDATPKGDATFLSREKKSPAIPWVLDPVACHLLAYRRELVREFLGDRPSLVRGNLAEIRYLQQNFPSSVGSVPMLATGEKDQIFRGQTLLREICGGVWMLQEVTATGCAQGAVCAAYLAWGQTPFDACISASHLMKRAGERAYEKAKTPGSFKIALVDALYELMHSEAGREGAPRTV